MKSPATGIDLKIYVGLLAEIMCHTRRDSMLGNNISHLRLHSLFLVHRQPPSNSNKLSAFGTFKIKQSQLSKSLSFIGIQTMCFSSSSMWHDRWLYSCESIHSIILIYF